MNQWLGPLFMYNRSDKILSLKPTEKMKIKSDIRHKLLFGARGLDGASCWDFD